MEGLKLLRTAHYPAYISQQSITLEKHLKKVRAVVLSPDNLGYAMTQSGVHSSMIEGNPLDLASFLKYRESQLNTGTKPYREINDLIAAYTFAQSQRLTAEDFLEAHRLLSQNLLESPQHQGQLRNRMFSIFDNQTGKLVYRGAETSSLPQLWASLWHDLAMLTEKEMALEEMCYFASMLHLAMAQLHPFADGNGRAARLLEKWFLAEKIGENAWFILSEKLYQQRLKAYYKNIHLGKTYEELDYDYCLPFLLMLPMALRLKK